MNLSLSYFAIRGLHGKIDISIPIRDNRLVLIGVNGLGKTTVVNILYYTLTEQWSRLVDYEYSTIELVLNNTEIHITKDEVASRAAHSDRQRKLFHQYAMRSALPGRFVQSVLEHPQYETLLRMQPSPTKDKYARQLSIEIGMPHSYLLRLLEDVPKALQQSLFDRPEEGGISMLTAALEISGSQQVLYLPTYRRIEQDLKAVFPMIDDDQLRKLTSAAEDDLTNRSRGHIELVQFGMQDVEKKIGAELESIQRRTRFQLSNLTASYLQDIIRYRADKIEPSFVALMSDDIVEAVLARVDENTLSLADKREVKAAITRLRAGSTQPEARDRYLTYFFSRLLEIYQELAKSESNIRRLIATCNKYLERKSLYYDDSEFTSHIMENDGAILNWKALSSGEKQVVSLFTHLHLSNKKSQVVIIDEPELSLSVPWQKTLLPDISSSESCKLLIAVTHSPFIYSNELERYAVDLSRYSKYYGN